MSESDLTVIEKRSESWRLNYPDFGAVCRGPGGRGIITDFQQVQDDPLKVNPMVKVKVEGSEVESSFIPLFYCPKEHYWDTEEHLAKDINQEKLYYENAWMSFRIGDEVEVILLDEVPVAVIGFLDNIPRLGEDLVRLSVKSHTCEIQVNVHDGGQIGDIYGGDWDLNMKGPDGLDLGLTKSCSVKLISDLPEKTSISWEGTSGGWGLGGSNLDDYYQGGAGGDVTEWFGYFYKSKNIIQPKLYAVNIPIGPILYSFRYVVEHSIITRELWINQGSGSTPAEPFPNNYHEENPPIIGGSWSKTTWDAERARSSWPSPVLPVSFVFAYEDNRGALIYQVFATWKSTGEPIFIGLAKTVDGQNMEANTTDDEFNSYNNYEPDGFIVGATLYKKELLDDPMAQDFKKQYILNEKLMGYLSEWGFGDPEFFVRPHSPSEGL